MAQSHSRGARIYDGDWQCLSEADTEQHHRWERGHVQGEAMLPRDGRSGYLPCHPRERTGAALPTAPGTLLHSLHQLPKGSAPSRDTGDTGVAAPAWAWHPLPAVPTGQSKHPQQSPPAPTPVLQTPGPHPANIPPGRSNTTTGTTGPQPCPHRARGSHKPPKPASPSRGELGMEPNWPLDHQPLPLP